MDHDQLKEAATFYNATLKEKKYTILVKKKHQEKELPIYFPTENFYHLAGLQKLKDIPIVQRSAKTVFREILDDKITYHSIERSDYLPAINDRLQFLPNILELLSTSSVYFQSLHGHFKGVKADFVIVKQFGEKFGFLFFALNKTDYCPCSFFTRQEQTEYTKDGTRWNIIGIRER